MRALWKERISDAKMQVDSKFVCFKLIICKQYKGKKCEYFITNVCVLLAVKISYEWFFFKSHGNLSFNLLVRHFKMCTRVHILRKMRDTSFPSSPSAKGLGTTSDGIHLCNHGILKQVLQLIISIRLLKTFQHWLANADVLNVLFVFHPIAQKHLAPINSRGCRNQYVFHFHSIRVPLNDNTD